MRRSVASILVAVALVTGALSGPLRPATAAVPAPLVGAGETWEKLLIDKLQNDSQSVIQPFVPEYNAFGSVQARQAVIAGTADYAVSEVPPTADEQAQAKAKGRTLAVVPYVGGAIALPFRIVLSSGDDLGSLQLSVPTLAKLFTGKINGWRDPQITADNGTAIAPAGQEYAIVVRRDSNSSTAALISLFLSDPVARPIWNSYAAGFGLAADTLPEAYVDTNRQQMPTVTGGCPEVVRKVAGLDPVTRQPDPSLRPANIGYCSSSWSLGIPSLHSVAVKNPAGQSVLPSSQAIAKQFAGATLDPVTNVVKLPYGVNDPEAYPVPAVSYLVVPVTGLAADKAKALAAFVRFTLTSDVAKKDAVDLGFAPANADWVTAGLKVVAQLEKGATITTTTSSSTSTTLARSGTQTPLAVAGSSGSRSGTTGGGSSASLPNTGGKPRWPLVAAGLTLFTMGETVHRRAGRRRRGAAKP